MRRRALLASLAGLATLSGCAMLRESTSPTGTPTPRTTTAPTTTSTAPTTTTTTDTPDPSYPRFVELAKIDWTDHPGLLFGVRVERPGIRADQTALLRGILENTGDSTVDLEMGYNPPFSSVRCEEGGYVLVEPGTAGDVDACWEQDHEPARPAELSNVTLGPGERVSNRMLVLGDMTTQGCLPTGEFRFASSFDVVQSQDRVERTNAFTINVFTD